MKILSIKLHMYSEKKPEKFLKINQADILSNDLSILEASVGCINFELSTFRSLEAVSVAFMVWITSSSSQLRIEATSL